MELFYHICEWLLILSLVGFIGALIWIGMTAIKIKNAVMADAKRLYGPPLTSVKAIITTGKGIAQTETIRAKRIAAIVKHTTASVKDAASDVQTTAQSIHPSDLQPVKTDIQFILRNLSSAKQYLELLAKLTPKSS